MRASSNASEKSNSFAGGSSLDEGHKRNPRQSCPRDEEFRNAWMTEPAHARLGEVDRIRTILSEIENGLRSPRAEESFVMPQGLLDVDHIMPDKWYEHWRLGGELVTAEEASATSLGVLFGQQQKPRDEQSRNGNGLKRPSAI
jgi:hypothetical protein